jgi:DNA-binding CsgD family transcriptional regulator
VQDQATRAISNCTPLRAERDGDMAVVFTLIGRMSNGDLLIRVAELEDITDAALLAREMDLSPREGDVLVWIARGKSNRDIGEILELSTRTVTKHVEQIFQKLGVENRTAAALAASRILSR